MLLWISVAVLVAAVTMIVWWLWSMRAVDRDAWAAWIMMNSGINRVLLLLNVRPKLSVITASNGVKLNAPNPVFGNTIETVLQLDVRQDDVIVATYPKAGTTWMQEIVWLMCNNADTQAAKQDTIMNRFAFLECADAQTEWGRGIQALETWPRHKQRLIKTHLQYKLLPERVQAGEKCKIIYVARNPKDVCVSYYHFHRMNLTLPDPGNWREFLKNFCSGNLGWGCWFEHNIQYWQKYQENSSQIYYVTFEALKRNLRGELERLVRFLEKDLTDDQLDVIAHHCTFESMSKNDKTNYSNVKSSGMDFKTGNFMRKGSVGDWKNHFTLNENDAFNALYEEKMKGVELSFEFEPDS